jgi:hypothetical protein
MPASALAAPRAVPRNFCADSWALGKLRPIGALNVEIFRAFRPQNFEILPVRSFEEITNPNNTHVVRMKALAPGEVFQLEMLVSGDLPMLAGVRSDAGEARRANFRTQPVAPNWLRNLLVVLIAIGGASVVYIALWIIERLIHG